MSPRRRGIKYAKVPAPLDGVRVLDASGGIAGPYATKVLADAGADVVTLEPDGGHPMRTRGSGALFEFLHASKRSVHGSTGDLIAGADVYVTDEPLDPEPLWADHRALVVVTVTPFGCKGPWVGRPWTEFTLQAACGSTGQRGLPDQPPLAAGGRVGEWVAGSFAAVGALAALHEVRRSGVGEHVDVAILDAMAVTMIPFPTVFAEFLGWPPMEGTGRQIEVPSIEPARDGYVVFTTNSAQQFGEFLNVIERPDLAEDRKLFQVQRRFARRDEFEPIVHAYTTEHTTDEILEAAAEHRVPAAPVLRGSTVTSNEHFAERGVFVPGPSGRFVQPRVPYAISGTEPRPFEPAPAAGEHTGTVDWAPRQASEDAGSWRLPLEGVRVIDCTAWWAGPAATHVLACMGADVIKVESTARPDHMRFTTVKPPPTDGWWEWCPVFHGVNGNKRGLTVDLSKGEGEALFDRLLGTADVLAENYTPRVMAKFGLDFEFVHARHPSLVMLRMPAFGLDGPWRDRTGFAQTMECLTGMAWLTGFSDGPPVLVRGACDPIAGLHSVIATLLALRQREQHGLGVLVESAMVEAALNAAAEQVVEFGVTGVELTRDGNRGPDAAPQGVYPCTGTDRWVAVAVTTDSQWAALVGVLELGDVTEFANDEQRREHHDQIDERISAATATRDAEEVTTALVEAGVPAAVVVNARDVAHNEQLLARGLFEIEHHAVTGDHPIPVMPFRFSRVARWLRAPAPTLGQDNEPILADLGLDELSIDALRAVGVVGERPADS